MTETTTAESLIDVMTAILQGDPTTMPPTPPPTAVAATDVQPYREWSILTLQGPFPPKITFDLPREEKESLGRAGPANFTVLAIITLRAFVSAKSAAAPGSDGGETRVRQALLALRRQIEVALVDAPALMGQIQQIKSIRSETRGGKDNNGVHLGELAMQLTLEFYQGPEDFASFTPDDLDLLSIDFGLADPAGADVQIDINLNS